MFFDSIIELNKNGDAITGKCPLCNSDNSFAIDSDSMHWRCSSCGRGGSEEQLVRLLYDTTQSQSKDIVDGWYQENKWPFPDETLIIKQHNDLLHSPKEIARLEDEGISLDVVKEHKIGINDLSISVPIATTAGRIADTYEFVPSYRKDVEDMALIARKSKAAARYFPVSAMEFDEIWIFQKIEDALVAREYGFNAIASTNQEYVAINSLHLLHRKNIYLVAGREQVVHVKPKADMFERLNCDVVVIGLPANSFREMLETKETDVSPDAFKAKYASLPLIVMDKTDKDNRPISEVSLLEAEFVSSQNEMLKLSNMSVIGAEPRTYALPYAFKVSCGKNNCDHPCVLAQGEHLIRVDDRDLLKFIDSSDNVQSGYISEKFRCKKVKFQVDAYINAQKVIFQEGASFVGGLDDATFESRYGVYLYDAYRLQATEKYDFKACKVSNPRNQFTNYVIHRAKRRDDVADVDFDVNHFKTMCDGLDSAEEVIKTYYKEWEDVLEVYGRPDLFAAIILTYASVTEIPFGVDTIKGWMDSMVIGDTRTGKSKMVQRFVKLLKMGSYINGENSRATGVIGGVQKYGESWIVTWGAIPMNDKGLLVIDEASGLEVNDIKNLSSTRSSGAVTLNKIVKGEARARTRLIWMSNPRSGRNLNEFFYQGFGAFQEFIPVAEDQSRFDVVISAAREDVDAMQFGRKAVREPCYEKWQGLFRYAWTVQAKDIEFEDDVSDRLLQAVKELNDKYGGGTMIIGVAVHEKLLRIACAFAVLTGSVRQYATLTVQERHINMACEFIESTLIKKTFGYCDYVDEIKVKREQKAKNIEYMRGLLRTYPALRILLSAPSFRGAQVAEVLGMEKMECSTVLSRMLVSGLLKPGSNSSYIPSDVLIEIMKEIEQR